ncbi:MAG: hypothetical protein NXI31_17265 [bacterium]|nr:hypothetical protein [bacterium]
MNVGPEYLFSDVDVFTASTTCVPETVTLRPYMLGSTNALATATLTVGPTPGFYRATFASPSRCRRTAR